MKILKILIKKITMSTLTQHRYTPFHTLLAAAALLASLLVAAPAEAATMKEAETFIQKLSDTALMSLTDKGLNRKEREARVRTVLKENFDINTIGRFAMGTHWREATAAQQTEYLRLFEDMIVQTYTTRFEEYSGQTMKVGNAIESGKRDILVSSQILQPEGPPLNLEWRIRERNGQMKIIDVVVEGISMSVTQRSDFSAVIQRGGGSIESLLTMLREKTSEAEKT